jgi:hypothetical protein
MEDVDDDTEVADYGTDNADDVDPNYDAEARPQQDPLSKLRSRRSFARSRSRSGSRDT